MDGLPGFFVIMMSLEVICVVFVVNIDEIVVFFR